MRQAVVWHDGRVIAMPAGQAPQLLGLLLLHAGQVISIDTVHDVLWEGDGPSSSRKVVQIRMSQLRRLFAHTPEDIVGSRPGLSPRASTPTCPVGLAPVLSEHPLRERVRVQLMITLPRGGRQSDALSVFDEGRRILAEELGRDPGTELRAAHTAVLQGDQRQPVPAQLPADMRGFAGREDELSTGATW